MKRIYLDYAATTPVHPDVVKEMLPYFTEYYGNPSSIYSIGQEAKEGIEVARTQVAALIGAQPEEIVFTGGGTEADNYAFKGLAFSKETKGNHFITTAIEHHAILETAHFLEERGFEVTYLPVDRDGLVDPAAVRKAITPQTVLVSVMHANNEVGTIEPVAEIARITREAGVYFHTDAVQTVGHLPIDVKSMGVDMLSMSAHKLYGPKGAGALIVDKRLELKPVIHGGGHERGLRSGTENVPAIVGFGAACELAANRIAELATRLAGMRVRLEQELNRMGAVIFGERAPRIPNTSYFAFKGIDGEALVIELDKVGYAVAAGAACSSTSTEPSATLLAMGVPPEFARGAVRFSLGAGNTMQEIEAFVVALSGVVGRLRRLAAVAV
jgi:cysteine desulfurase